MVGHDAKSGDYRPAGTGLRWGGQVIGSELLELFVQEFIVIVLAAKEHHGRADCANQAEQAQHFLHGESSSLVLPHGCSGLRAMPSELKV
jgi:hypothetical protein